MILTLTKIASSFYRPKSKLPNPVPLPVWLQTLLWATRPTESLKIFAQKLPEPFTFRMVGDRRYVVVSHPDAVKEMFSKFPCVGNDELLPFLGPNSIFLLQGRKHHRHRKVLIGLFQGEHVDRRGDLIREVTQKAVNSLKAGQIIDVSALTKAISLEIILKSILGLKDGELLDRLKRLMTDIIRIVNGPALFFELLQKDLGPLTPGRKINKTLQELNELILSVIRNRKRNEVDQGDDALSAMIDAKEELPFTEDELLDELKSILSAGHEPTAAALSWALYWIFESPGVYDKLMAEILSSQAKTSAEVGKDEDTYLNAVCLETLRIIPVVPATDRLVTKPTVFQGKQLLPGDRLIACTYLTHHRPEIYPEPSRFMPERFMKSQFSPYEYYPFGGHNRRCIGAQLAPFEMKIILHTLFSKVCFAVPKKRKKVRIVQRGATLGPSHEHHLRVTGFR